MAIATPQQWLLKIKRSRHPLWIVAVLSFFETIIIPIPIELILIPLMAADRERIWLIATMTTAGCLLGSLTGYGVGMLVFESAGRWFIEIMGYGEAYKGFTAFFDQHGFVAILIVGIVPIPFQVAMIAAGVAGYPLPLFVLAAVIARGVRYYGLAWLILRFGGRARELWQRHAVALTISVGAAMLLLYFVGQYLAGQVL